MKLSDDLPKSLIFLKGGLFVLILLMASALVLLADPLWQRAGALLAVIWSSARCYYFMFYVIERYVEPSYKFSSVYSFLLYLLKKKP